MSKDLHCDFNRTQLMWLYRTLEAGKDRAEGLLKKYAGPQSEDKTQEINEAVAHKDYLTSLCMALKDCLDGGERKRFALSAMKAELEEAKELVGEDEKAQAEIVKRLANLPEEEPYRITLDRPMVKFILKLVENDLQKFRAHVIPTYEKASEESFQDVIQTKTYFINKSRKSKDLLDNIKVKLEKLL